MKSRMLTITTTIKKKDPVRFLELFPVLFSSCIVEKSPLPKWAKDTMLNESIEFINKRISSPYNIMEVIKGGILFLVGKYAMKKGLLTHETNFNDNKQKGG